MGWVRPNNAAHIIAITNDGTALLSNGGNADLEYSNGDGTGSFLEVNPFSDLDSTNHDMAYYTMDAVMKALDKQLPEICRHLEAIASVLYNNHNS